MNRKMLSAVVVLAVALALAAWMRTDNRADAASGNCYSETQGPNEPTICN